MDQADCHQQGLYRPEFEHDSCGTGFITHINGHKSNQTVSDALTILENMEHRGACGCDPNSGDGAGILIQIPHEFFVEEAAKINIKLPKVGHYGAGILFLPKKPTVKEACKKLIQVAAEKTGLQV